MNKKQTKSEETTEQNKVEQVDIREVYGDKLLPFGKTVSVRGYNVIIDEFYSEFYVNEEKPHLYDFKVVFHIVIDNQSELSDKNYHVLRDYYDGVEILDESGNTMFNVSPNATHNNVLDDDVQFSLYVEDGDIHIYCLIEDMTRETNLGKRIFHMWLYYETEEERHFSIIPYMLSEGIQYYDVNGQDIIVTDYGVIAEKSFEIDTMQVYGKDGTKAFDDEEMGEIESGRLGDEYIYAYDPINANDVEYIEVNGEKYYPEGEE